MIPKGVSRNRKSSMTMTDNTMAKRKGQPIAMIYKNTTQKTKDRAARTPLKSGKGTRCSRRVNSSCSTSDTSVTL